MIDKAQTEIVKTLWDQSRAAAQQAYEAWGLVIKSQKAMMDSMRGMGAPFAVAADQFDKLVQFQAQQYEATVAYMEKATADFQKLMQQQKK